MPAQTQRRVYEFGSWEVDLIRRELRAHGAPVPIGGRAFEIIETLVQSSGELVTKDELMERVWSGVVVEENALQVHISAIRKALNSDRALLKTVHSRGYRLLGSWTIVRKTASVGLVDPDPMPAQPFVSNLPAAVSDLIGRAAAMEHVRDLLSAYRVVTFTGPGGIGKTRLAIEVARSLFPGFRGDGWLVELVALSDPRLVPSAVASVLGLRPGDEISAETVARAIGGRNLLLVLDNCEHVIDAAATLVETVVRLCPYVTVLATSREALRIEGERTYRVPPLDVPAQDSQEPDSVLQPSAVQLFIARTQALQSDFSPYGADFSLIGAICRRLDGIPLAIELAAARAATLGLEPVLSRLDERFGLLTGGRRTALPRHKTLRATLDWSYELLPEAERRVLCSLAVFAAGFTIEAAAAVAGGTGTAAPTLTEAIASLVAKSLVALDTSGTASRWRLLETTRAYALEKLTEAGEAEYAMRRHAGFFRDLVAPAAGSQPTAEDLARYAAEIDNVRAALDWAFSQVGDAAIGTVLTAAYVPVWLQLLLIVECTERVEHALCSLSPEANLSVRLRAQLHITLGFALLNTGGLAEKTRAVLAKGLELAESLGDEELQLQALWATWSVYFNIGKYGAARSAGDRLLCIARRIGDPSRILVGERLVGSAMHFLGNQAQARRSLERVLNQQAPADGPRAMWFLLDQRIVAQAMLARVLLLQGFVDQANRNAQISLEEAQATNDKLAICYALRNGVCPLALTIGDLATAEWSVAMLVDLVARQGMAFWTSWGSCLEGQLLIRRGEFAKGSTLLRSAIDARVRAGWLMRIPEFLGVLAEGLAAIGRLAEALATVEEALCQSYRDGQRWFIAELLRIKAELLLQEAGSDPISVAEDYLFRAIGEAQQQGALLWELRAALSLARLRVRQDRHGDGRQLLTPIYDRFTEGYETPDLKSARAMLDVL
jgi:predicted ATPase/DNA-binding winged helix-turn-helix (wHTH) protein